MPKLSDLSPYHKRLIRQLRRKNALLENTKSVYSDLYWSQSATLGRIRTAVQHGQFDRIEALIAASDASGLDRWKTHDVAEKQIKRKFNRRRKDDL